MSRTALVVHVTVDPAQREALLGIVREHATRCIELEPGCLRFEVMPSAERADELTLVEVYRDREALDTHWASEHMATFRARAAALLRGREAHICTLD